MTERSATGRNALRARLDAAGLRLSPVELEELLPAWRRYQDLLRELEDRLPPDPTARG